jgi:hypothetical protein
MSPTIAAVSQNAPATHLPIGRIIDGENVGRRAECNVDRGCVSKRPLHPGRFPTFEDAQRIKCSLTRGRL